MKKQAVLTTTDYFEDITYPDGSLPIHFCTDEFKNLLHHEINCHWHNDFEFAYQRKGSCLYSFYGEEQQEALCEGDAVFVNSKALHSAVGTSGDAVMDCFTISPFFFGKEPVGSIFVRSVRPLLNSDTAGVFLHAQNDADKELIGRIKAVLAVREDSAYCDLLYLEAVSRLWRCLCCKLDSSPTLSASAIQPQKASLVRLMLSYIHTHYGADLTVEALAAHANISRTECFRLFKKNVGKSPVDYILSYRLAQAARLLAESEKSVSEIYETCGFHSGSYFSGKFKQAYGATPREYCRRFREGRKALL